MNNNLNYKVNLNNDDVDSNIDYIKCLNNPVATVTIDMQNKYGKNITELFRAFGKTNDYKYIDGRYEGYGVSFYFDFTSVNFENVGYYYRVDRSNANCIETINMEDGNIVSNVEIDYVISDMDWKDENTTITELNNNIAENLVYCLSNNNIRDTNFSVLRQNYYFIAKNNVVYVYACDNKCSDLSVTYFRYPDGTMELTKESFVLDITNPNQNNMNVKYSTFSGIQEIPLVLPVNITVTEGIFPSEITWSVLQNGIEIISGGPNESVNPQLPPGDYVFRARDSYGDGWNGATYTIRKYDGDILATGTLEDGSVGNFPFTVPVYNIIDYKVALDSVIDSMTQQFKQLLPEKFKNLEKVAYTTIYNGKIYISIDNNIANPLWLEGNGVEVTPLYSNLDLSLTDQEIVETWSDAPINILTLKNY